MRANVLGLFSVILISLVQAAPGSSPQSAEVGKPAPVFRLNDHTGKVVPFGGKHEGWSVLAFFPKAATPG